MGMQARTRSRLIKVMIGLAVVAPIAVIKGSGVWTRAIEVGSHSRVFVVAFLVFLFPGFVLLKQWRERRGWLSLGILAGMVIAAVVLFSTKRLFAIAVTSAGIRTASWVQRHWLLVLLIGIVAVALFYLLWTKVIRKRWADSALLSIVLGGVGGLVLSAIVVVGFSWQGRYGNWANVQVPPVAASLRPYVALGDSYSAGEGLKPFSDNACHRSLLEAYGVRLSDGSKQLLAPELFVACSGARTENIFLSPQQAGGQVQWSAAAMADARLVTLTLGGNDLRFSEVLTHCFRTPNCLATTFTPSVGGGPAPVGPAPLADWARQMIPIVQDRLATVFGQLRAGAPQARIIVLGYPKLLPTGDVPPQFDVCDAVLAAVDSVERDGLSQLQTELNEAVYAAATATGVEFIDPVKAFSSHEACGVRGELIHSYNLRLNGFAEDPGAFHPTAQGQRTLAREIACYLSANPNAPAPTTTKKAPGTKVNPIPC